MPQNLSGIKLLNERNRWKVALEIKETFELGTWSKKSKVIIAMISLLLGITIFTIAYIGMSKNIGLSNFNQPVLDWMISHRKPQITDTMKIITESANPLVFVVAISIISGLWVIVKREIWRPFLLISSVGFAAGLSTVLKTVTANSRPPIGNMIAPLELDYSFPSGHTIGVFVFLLVIGYLLCSRRSSDTKIFICATLTAIGTGLVAGSRLYLGYHWLTDIIASIGLGFTILAFVVFIDITIGKRFKN